MDPSTSLALSSLDHKSFRLDKGDKALFVVKRLQVFEQQAWNVMSEQLNTNKGRYHWVHNSAEGSLGEKFLLFKDGNAAAVLVVVML